jgi:16S rRNA (cytosine1402-N4)-methyltransferase
MSTEEGVLSHQPVMLQEVLDILQPSAGKKYIDATFGGGGYSQALLKTAPCTVWGIDRDPEAVKRGQMLEKEFQDRFKMIEGEFGHLLYLVKEKVDGVVFDLGVSSYQLDCPERGFSFRYEGPLDMRMDPSKGLSAAEVVNYFSQEELADIIYYYGEERYARRLARAIVKRRQEAYFHTTQELASFIRSLIKKDKSGIDPATRTFQALRIFVNDEINQLKEGLKAAAQVLKGGGKIVVVSFHSLEDREVKKIFLGQKTQINRYAPPSLVPFLPVENIFISKRKGVLYPAPAETMANPRARSARLRFAEKVEENTKEESDIRQEMRL